MTITCRLKVSWQQNNQWPVWTCNIWTLRKNISIRNDKKLENQVVSSEYIADKNEWNKALKYNTDNKECIVEHFANSMI